MSSTQARTNGSHEEPSRPSQVRIDPDAAFKFWASLPVEGRSYAAVAERFGVSRRTIERYGCDGRWRDRIRLIEANAAARLDEELGVRRARQLANLHQLVDESCITYARQLASGDVRISAAEFVSLIKVALLLHGAPAERVEVVSRSEEWVALRSRILDAVSAFPEARLALARAIESSADDEQTRG